MTQELKWCPEMGILSVKVNERERLFSEKDAVALIEPQHRADFEKILAFAKANPNQWITL